MVLLLLCTLSSFAQNKNITVSGRVIEEDTKEPVEMATVNYLLYLIVLRQRALLHRNKVLSHYPR